MWESARFISIFLASSFSCSQALSTPAHTQVTQAVGRLVMKHIIPLLNALIFFILSACMVQPATEDIFDGVSPTVLLTSPNVTPLKPISVNTAVASKTPFPTDALEPTAIPTSVSISQSNNIVEFAALAHWSLNGYIRQVGFSPDGKLLAIATPYGVHFYNAETLEKIKFIEIFHEVRLSGEGGPSGVDSFSISPHGETLASSCDGLLQIWNILDGSLLQTMDVELSASMAFSPDGKYLVAKSTKLQVWQTSDWKLIYSINLEHGWGNVIFSPDGALMASVNNGQTVLLWKTSDWSFINKSFYESDYSIVRLDFAPNGNSLVLGTHYGIIVLSVNDGNVLKRFKRYADLETGYMALSPDGQITAMTSYDGKVYLRMVSDGTLTQTLSVSGNPLLDSIAFSPDGSILVTGGTDSAVHLWKVKR